jgi:hypothetical protein
MAIFGRSVIQSSLVTNTSSSKPAALKGRVTPA